MPSGRQRTILLILGVNLLAAAGVAELVRQQEMASVSEASVVLLVVPPEGPMLFDGTVRTDGEATVLGALRAGAKIAGFEVATYEYPGLGTMVVSVAGHENQGACGWVYAVNEGHGDRAASDRPVRTGDRVRWSWSCAS